MWPSGAPLVFDIVGGGVAVGLMTVFFALSSGKPLPSYPVDPRSENFMRLPAAVAGCVLAGYVLYTLAGGLGGVAPLFLFLVRAPQTPQPWSVWLALGGLAILTTVSVFNLCRALAAPLGDRGAMPYGKSLLGLAVAGGLWWWGAFFPVPDGGRDTLWYLAMSANFGLQCIYLTCVTEAATGLILPLLPGGGKALRVVKRQLDERNAPLRPARPRRWWR